VRVDLLSIPVEFACDVLLSIKAMYQELATDLEGAIIFVLDVAFSVIPSSRNQDQRMLEAGVAQDTLLCATLVYVYPANRSDTQSNQME